jgi:large-conductance mechanosensitive channel
MDGSTSVLTIAVGLYVGMSLAQFFTSIARDLITPILAGVFPGAQSTADKLVIQIGSVKIQIGDAIGATINLLIAWFIVSTTLPYLKTYAPIGGRR